MGIDTMGVKSALEEVQIDVPDILKDRIAAIIRRLDEIEEGGMSLRETMDVVFRAKNLVRLKISGIQLEEGERLLQIADENLAEEELLNIPESLIKQLAEMLYKSKAPKEGDTIVISGVRQNIQILEEIARLCIADGVNFLFEIIDQEFEADLINKVTDEQSLQKLAEERISLYAPYNLRLAVMSNPDPSIYIDSDKMNKYGEFLTPLTDRAITGDLDFCLTVLPTKADAELDGMDYDDYIKLFFEACNQPWDEIHKAQGRLIERLDNGKEIRIVNDDGTDLTFDIDGFTFVNSTIEKNIPGAEVYSAPLKTGVNGILVSKGLFKYRSYPLIRNITLRFENGRIVDYDAEEGREALEQIITSDDGKGEGSRFLGEIAFGTNPCLKRHLVNGLLVEKIGGSFHVALGKCFTFKQHEGVDVNVDNGNKSASGVHFDLTTMLRGKNGKVYLDGKLIQNDGIWVGDDGVTPDEELAVLNGS